MAYDPFDTARFYATEGGDVVSPARRKELLAQADENALGPLSDLFWLLDTPGAMVREGLSGNNPLGALSKSTDERVDGRELLRQYGLVGEEDTAGNFVAGLGADILLDPTAWLSGGSTALTKAGKVASKAGLLHQAPKLLSKQFVRTGGQGMAPELAERAASKLGSLKRSTISETEIAGRPLLGRRASQKYGTLGDLLDNADAPDAAYKSALDAVGGREDILQGLRDQALGGDIGIGLPFMQNSVALNVPGLGAVSDAFDAGFDALRWSAPGRALSAAFTKEAGGALDATSQAIYAGADDARKSAEAAARGESAFQAAKLFQSEPDVFTEEGNRALGRLIEKPKESALRSGDAVWESQHPAARAYMAWWRDRSDELAEDFTEAGLRGARFADPNIEGYLPRKADGLLERSAYADPAGAGRILGTQTTDQASRDAALMVPGGRDTIAFDLSRDPVVAGAKRSAGTDEAAALHIASKLYGTPTTEQMKQARDLAKILHRLPEGIIKQTPLFGQHPTETIARYVQGREGAKATINSMYDALAAHAANQSADLVEQGRHISLNEALARVGARTITDEAGESGARMQMRSRLASRFGGDPDKFDLATVSVPEDLVGKLVRAREVFETPEAAKVLFKPLYETTRVWKSGILSWPRRIVRDLISGAFSNALEGALDVRAIPVVRQVWDAISGTAYATGKTIASKSAFDPQVVQYLKTMPRYAGEPVEDVGARFYADLAATGLLDAGVSADPTRAIVGAGYLDNILPGAERSSFLLGRGSAVGELASRNYNPLSRSFWDVEQNPLSRAGAKAGNLSDMINRLTGYMSLLRQGVDPMEAARRMKRAHVDYSSLSPVERYIRDNGVPFYAYASRITQEVSRQLFERPGGRYGQMIRAYERAQDTSDEQVPEQLRNQFAVAIDPDNPLLGFLADPDRTTTTYFTDLDLPGLDQLNMLDIRDPSATMSNLSQQLNPYMRVASELATGKDAFTRMPINASARGYGPYSKLARYITGDDNAGTGTLSILADKAIDLTPYLSRPARTIASTLNPDNKLSLSTNAFSTAFNELGLGKLRDVTAEDIRYDQIKRLEKLAAPYTREYTIPSIPKGLEGRVPQDAVDSLALARELQREGRDLRRRRMAQTQ